MKSKKQVVVFRSHFSPDREGWMFRQAKDFEIFEPTFMSLVNLATPNRSSGIFVKNLRQLWFKLTGLSSSLESQIVKNRTSLILAHFAQEGWRISRIATRLKIPLVVYVHGSDVLIDGDKIPWFNLTAKSLNRNWPLFFSHTAAFVCASEFLAARLIEMGCPSEKVHVNYLGVDVQEAETVSRLIKSRYREITICSAGRFIENKGFLEIVNAFAEVKRQYPAVQLKLIGDGPQRAEIEEVVQDLDLENSVSIISWLPHLELLKEIAQSHLYVQASKQARDGSSEGFGLAPLEAQFVGTTALVTNTGGLPETCTSPKLSMICEPDVSSLTSAMSYFLMMRDLDQNRLQAIDYESTLKFSQRLCSQRLELILEKIVE